MLVWVLAVTKGEEPYLQNKSDSTWVESPFDCGFKKGSHAPDLIVLVKSWSCCCSEPCAEASTEVCTERTQSNLMFKQNEKEIKQ